MEQQVRQNPLKNYFRQIKLYIKLPSGTSYYKPGTINYTTNGEVGIYPMTGKDELILKNPDALLNGEALIEVIRSCVPAVSDPKLLLTNDIDALITAVRLATYNDTLETELTCPMCNADNLFKLDLQYSLDNMSFLDPQYVVNLDSGLSVYVKPHGFPELLSGLHAQFEQGKLKRAISADNITEEQQLKMFSAAFKELSNVTYTLTYGSVIRIVDESNNVDVTDKEFIKDFLQNIDKTSIDKITDLVKEINLIGIKRSFTATCNKCSHEWVSEIEFNPVNFS